MKMKLFLLDYIVFNSLVFNLDITIQTISLFNQYYDYIPLLLSIIASVYASIKFFR